MKLPIEDFNDYHANMEEILAQFSPEFVEKYNTGTLGAFSVKVVGSLIRGSKPLVIIEQLLSAHENAQALLEQAVKNSALPHDQVFATQPSNQL